jgi:hypothetical protein
VQALEMACTVGCNELVAKPVNENELMDMVIKLQHDYKQETTAANTIRGGSTAHKSSDYAE